MNENPYLFVISFFNAGVYCRFPLYMLQGKGKSEIPYEGVNAKKDGLVVYAFRFTSATESYLAAVVDSI